MQHDKKVITILGVGGHGSSAYRDFITNPIYQDYKINLILGVDDSGGHTGEVKSILPEMDLGIDTNFVLPFGDLRANIERFVFNLEPDGERAKQKVDAMSGAYVGNDINEFNNACLDFCRVFDISDESLILGFLSFCNSYFNIYQTKSDFANKHKIGNLFLTFMFINSNLHHEIFFKRLKEYGLIPPRVFLHFIYTESLELHAENLDLGMRFNSEAEVDDAKVPVSPSTYSLVKASDSQPLTAADIEVSNYPVMKAIRESEVIVLSTGSVANLFGQVNLLAEELRDSPAIKLWLGNIATTNNEVNFTVLMTYYFSPERLGLDGIVLQMSEEEFDNLTINADNSIWVERYRKQGKTFVNIGDLIANIQKVFNYNGLSRIINLVQPILGITMAGNEIATRIPGWESLSNDERDSYKTTLEQSGIKYITTEITLFIRFFYELNHFLNRELQVEERTARYYLIAEILKRLRLSEKEDPAAEISIYTELLTQTCESDTELKEKFSAFIQAISDNNPELKKEELAEILQFPHDNESNESELRLA